MPLLPLTSDSQAQTQMVDQGGFVRSVRLPNRLQDLNPLPSTTATTHQVPDPMEASNMGAVQNQEDAENQQACKYDLLSSVPCKSDL